MVLWIPPGQTLLPNNIIRARLGRFCGGQWRELLEEFWAAVSGDVAAAVDAQNQPIGRRPRRAPTGAAPPAAAALSHLPADLRARTQRCINLCDAGEYARATTALLSNDAASASSAATTAKLQNLFPPARQPLDRAAIAAFDPPPPDVKAQDFYEALLTMARKSAGGCSGLSADHMCDILLDSGDLRAAFLPVIQRVAAGRVPDAVKPLLATAKVIAIDKPRDPTSVRPIAMGEWIRRITAKCLLRSLAVPIAAHFAPTQLGIGITCGIEAAVKSVQAAAELYPGKILLFLDIAAAFQNISRTAFFKALMEHNDLRVLVPFARIFYMDQSVMYFDEGADELASILCSDGTHQGCTMGNLFFSLGIHPILAKIKAETELVVAIADDKSLVVEPTHAVAVLDMVTTELAAVGCTLQLHKSVALSLTAAIPAEIAAKGLRCIDASLPLDQRGAIYCGAPVGTASYRCAQLAAVVAGFESDLARLSHCLGGTHLFYALKLLRMCFLPRFMYQLRCNPPGVTLPYAAAFDDAVLRCFQQSLAPPYPRTILHAANSRYYAAMVALASHVKRTWLRLRIARLWWTAATYLSAFTPASLSRYRSLGQLLRWAARRSPPLPMRVKHSQCSPWNRARLSTPFLTPLPPQCLEAHRRPPHRRHPPDPPRPRFAPPRITHVMRSPTRRLYTARPTTCRLHATRPPTRRLNAARPPTRRLNAARPPTRRIHATRPPT
jgi:hypothetical protein